MENALTNQGLEGVFESISVPLFVGSTHSVTTMPVINLDSGIVFQREYRGKLPEPDNREAVGELAIARSEEGFTFQAHFRLNGTYHTYRGGRRNIKRDFSGAANLGFNKVSLENYSNPRGIDNLLPEEYFQLRKTRDEVNESILANIRGMGSQAGYRKNQELKLPNQLRELNRQLEKIYIETALKHFGEEWVSGLEPRIRKFIETDGRPQEYGGNGDGPYLINYIRVDEVPRSGCQMIPCFPGSYGTARRRGRSR